jgi:hypothetical protein
VKTPRPLVASGCCAPNPVARAEERSGCEGCGRATPTRRSAQRLPAETAVHGVVSRIGCDDEAADLHGHVRPGWLRR